MTKEDEDYERAHCEDCERLRKSEVAEHCDFHGKTNTIRITDKQLRRILAEAATRTLGNYSSKESRRFKAEDRSTERAPTSSNTGSKGD